MADNFLSDDVWLLKGLVVSEPGTLTLENGRLSFTTDKLIFDIPLVQIQAAKFPWYNFGAGCTLRINGEKYRISFIEPGNTSGGEYASISDARRKGKLWKTALVQISS